MSSSRPPQRRHKKKPSAGIDREIPQLPVPPHRRLPKYQRAQERYSWDAWVPRERCGEAERRWAQHDIQPFTIYRVLRQAAIARMDYEGYLANDLELAKEEIVYRALIRGLNQRLKSVFAWLQQDRFRWLPDAQVTEGLLRRAVSEVAENLVSLAPHAVRTFRFRGRPGEPWLQPIIAQLSKIFRGHGMRANAATRAIVEALTLAGHGNVVNVALVKRLTRKH